MPESLEVFAPRGHVSEEVAGTAERENRLVVVTAELVDDVVEQQRILEPAVALLNNANAIETASGLAPICQPAHRAADPVGPVHGRIAFQRELGDFALDLRFQLDCRVKRLVRFLRWLVHIAQELLERFLVATGDCAVNLSLNFGSNRHHALLKRKVSKKSLRLNKIRQATHKSRRTFSELALDQLSHRIENRLVHRQFSGRMTQFDFARSKLKK
ncbi:hypothetical protein [Sinorhizobium meliloti]|uniref:hypothetical protein n=1 Tax=Rhizobium meliloti TaxID=382 RepID=UPI001F235EED|nr:hypothetical protein [Sinorhizobium meliloti]